MPDENAIAEPMRLKQVMAELALSGPLSVARVANRLGTTPRTLQRHLALQCLTFRALVDEVRLDAARTLLCQTDLPVQEVAVRLGYRTPSSFARAFARWTGTPPHAYRRRIRVLMENDARGAKWAESSNRGH